MLIQWMGDVGGALMMIVLLVKTVRGVVGGKREGEKIYTIRGEVCELSFRGGDVGRILERKLVKWGLTKKDMDDDDDGE